MVNLSEVVLTGEKQMQHRFKRPWRQFRKGDTVPDSLGSGMVRTMLDNGIIEPDAEPAKAITEPPCDKAIRPNRKGRKPVVVTK